VTKAVFLNAEEVDMAEEEHDCLLGVKL